MSNLQVKAPFIPESVDTPLDGRSRIAALADVESIELPYVGMKFFCLETGLEYRVLSLKSKQIGAATVANAAIDEYAAIPDGTGTGMTDAERARLLPDDAADGDLAVCREGVDRGNGANTRLLVQPLASDGAIADSAYGNAAPIPVTNTGVTVDENGWMVFNGSSRLSFGAGVLPSDVLATDKEWQLDILFNAAAWPENYYGGYYCLFGQGNTPRFDILLNSSGDMSIAGNPSLGSGWSLGADHLLTLESYYDGADWRFTAFRAGAVVSAGTWGQTNLRTGEIGVGSDMDYRYFFGRMGAVRLAAGATHRGQPFAPLALPWLPSAKAWQLLKASDAIVRNKADRFSFSGQLKPVSESIAVSGSQTVVLDAAQYSRWILTGSGTATLDLENWEDGDKGEMVIDTSAVNPVIPAEWVTLGADITTTPGLYVLEIAQVGTTVFYAIRYPNSGGTVSSISDHISIVNGYWYLDGVSTGVAATGPKGDKGDTGNAGATGYVTTVISANQPQSPVDGTIWIQP